MQRFYTFVVSAAVAVALHVAAPARADTVSLVANGGCEAGFSGWTRTDQLGSDGTFFVQAGTASPVIGDPVPPPPGGASAAMTDAQGPGSHVLYQDFVVPTGRSSMELTFDYFVGNRAGDFYSPQTLDFATPTLNQQARVDVLAAGADPFSVGSADVLMNVFQTRPGDPLVTGYNTLTTDLSTLLSSHAGQTLRLRFAEVDNVFTMQYGVDNVSVTASSPPVVPVPAGVWGGAALLGALGVAKRLRPSCAGVT